MEALDLFAPATRTWFSEAFEAPTRVQTLGWPHLASGRHALLLAPTGSGKTLAAFLSGLDRLSRRDPEAPAGVRLLYVSPMKALAYDVERNLRAPLVGMARCAERLSEPFTPISIGVRTGDTPQRDRQRMLRHPPDVLVTTPESLFLMLGSGARGFLKTVETVILDEIHAVAGTKRGVHMALSLERLAELTRVEEGASADGPQRIGLSATQRPLSRIAGFLGGGRDVEIVDTSEPPHISLSIQVSVADMDKPVSVGPTLAEPAAQRVSTSSTTGQGTTTAIGGGDTLKPSIWPTIYPKILELIRSHTTTIVFTNSRLLCERLSQRLNELAGEELVRAHHGSVARHQRETIEEMLKAGQLPAIVATSTLELGIDMGTVDLVIQIESPNSVASGLQRIGRAGHGVGELSEGVLFPKFKGDLLQSVVVARAMAEGAIEETRVPKNCLDVLSQHLVSACAVESWQTDALFALVRKAAPYVDLPRSSFEAVLDMLAGRYPSDEFADLRPRLSWDRAKDELTARKGAGMLALMNAGTIPDRGLFGVFLGDGGPRIGELDEEMVHESRRGDVIILGASSWRIEELTRDKVVVSPAPGEPGRLPFWHGDRPGRPIELGRRLGAFVREIDGREDAEQWLVDNTPVDALAARNLVDYLRSQREATGLLPHDKRIVVERFKDELGDWRICILSPFGSKVHAPWALALQSLLAAHASFDVQAMYTDDGIVLRLADTEELPDDAWLWPEPEEVEDLIVEQLAHSSVFAARFRENAGRALLLPKRRPDKRSPLWAQRLKAQQLQAVAERFPSFPIMLETYRECLSDVFDLDALKEVLTAVRSREIRVETVETRTASPFARSLVFAYVAAYMYEGDAPLAERRAQALTLDRGLLRELLGQEALRELLDADAVDEVEAELQGYADGRRCKDADHVHDLLRRVGDLTQSELSARCIEELDLSAALDSLRSQRRAIAVHIAGESRWIAADDAGRYLHGLGVAIAPGLPMAFMEAPHQPLVSLFLRFARTRGPFLGGQLAQRYGMVLGAVDPLLVALEAEGHLVRGELRPGGTRAEWCHVDVLRRLKRRSLAKLRREIEPVDSAVLARFLVDWHGFGSKRSGPGRLREVLAQLEGLPIGWSQLETEVLPARIPGYRGTLLDELAHSGEWVWVGVSPLGSKDGKVMLLQRERAPLLLPDPPDEEQRPAEPLHDAIVAHLETRGASFLTALQGATGAKSEELMPALWDLVWAGLVTNDSFLPLRGLRARRRSRNGSARFAGGRWSLVSELRYRTPTPTERAHARSVTWLERYGVICRQVPRLEGVSGGFSSVYPVLRAMEEQGKARRGHFVDGLEGAQFALPGTVDRLRGHREPSGKDAVLAAADPANPYGSLLPWGPCSGTPKRKVGAVVVLVDGRAALWIDKGGKRFLTLEAFGEPALAKRAIEAWVAGFDRHKSLHVHHIDGGPAKDSGHARVFRELGFAEDYKGLIRVQ